MQAEAFYEAVKLAVAMAMREEWPDGDKPSIKEMSQLQAKLDQLVLHEGKLVGQVVNSIG